MTELTTAPSGAPLADADIMLVRKAGVAGVKQVTAAEVKAYALDGFEGGGGTPVDPELYPVMVTDIGAGATAATSQQTFAVNTFTKLQFLKTTDSANLWNDTTFEYTASRSGPHLIVLGTRMRDGSPAMKTALRVSVNNIADTNALYWTGNVGDRLGMSATFVRALATGDKLIVEMMGAPFAGDTTTTQVELAKARLSIVPLVSEVAGGGGSGGGSEAEIDITIPMNAGYTTPYSAWGNEGNVVRVQKVGRLVMLSGLVNGPQGIIATLPPEFRPRYSRIMSATGEPGNVAGRLQVSSNGEIFLGVGSGAVGTYVTLAVTYLSDS